MLLALRHRLPRLGRFPRLCAVGICLLLAAQSAASPATSRPASAVATAPVVVAARPLPAGHLLRAADVRVARWPAGLRAADGFAETHQVIGRRVAGPLVAREPVTAARLVGRELAIGLGPDLVAAAVPLADARAVDLVRAGDRVDLLSTARTDALVTSSGPATVGTLARAARVLAVLPADASSADGSGAEVVLAVSRPVAVSITRDAASRVFTVVLAPP